MSDQTPGSTGPNPNQNPNATETPHFPGSYQTDKEAPAHAFVDKAGKPVPLEDAMDLGLLNIFHPDGTNVTREEFFKIANVAALLPDTLAEVDEQAPTYDKTSAHKSFAQIQEEIRQPETKKKWFTRRRYQVMGAVAGLAAAGAAVFTLKNIGDDTPTSPQGPVAVATQKPGETTGPGTVPESPGASQSPENPDSTYLDEAKKAEAKLKAEMLILGNVPITFDLVQPLLRSQKEVDVIAKKNAINYRDQLVKPDAKLYPTKTTEAMNIDTLIDTQKQLDAVFASSAHLEKITGGEFDATKLYVTPEEFAAAAQSPAARDALLAKIANTPGEFVKLAIHAQVKNDPATVTQLLNASRITDSQINEALPVVEFYGRPQALDSFKPDQVLIGKGEPSKPMALGSIEKGAIVSLPDEAYDLGMPIPHQTSLTMFVNIDRNTVRSELQDGQTVRYAGPGSRSLFQTYVFRDVSKETGVEGASVPVLVAEYHSVNAE